MDGRKLAEIALKVWGVVMLTNAIVALPTTLYVVTVGFPDVAEGDWSRTWGMMNVLEVAVSAIIGLSLLIWAESIACSVIPPTSALQLHAHANQLAIIAFGTLGVFLVVGAIKEAIPLIVTLLDKSTHDPTGNVEYLLRQSQGSAVAAALQLGLGVLLVVGRRGLGKAWWRMRGMREGDIE